LNNLFVASLALLFFKDPGGFVSLNALAAAVLFFPMSADPLRKIPPVRLALWPLGPGERGLLRLLAMGFNPMPWALAALALRKSLALDLWALISGIFALAFVASTLPAGSWLIPFRMVPHFPGALDQLIRKNLRQTVCTLDFYCALLIGTAGLASRCAGVLPRQAFLPLTMLIVLALSTSAANLFGLEKDAGMTRYRLLPIPGWQVLAAKDAAFLIVTFVLTLPLSPIGGLAAGVTGLACGHFASVNRRHADVRWRFSTNASVGGGLLQMAVMGVAAAGAANGTPLLLIPCLVAYMWSAWHCGRRLEVSH
jgi:hypothetical protein